MSRIWLPKKSPKEQKAIQRTENIPADWGTDSLTGFMQDAHRNRFATFANKERISKLLIDIDKCFETIAKDWRAA